MSENHANIATQPAALAIAATFTAESLEPPLAFWIQELQLPLRIAFAPYNQVFQELLDPASLLGANHKGVNVVLVRLADWQPRDTAPGMDATGRAQRIQEVEKATGELIDALTAAARRSSAFHLVVLCPGSPRQQADPSCQSFFREMEDRIAAELGGVPGIRVVTSAELKAVYPVAAAHDPHTEQLAHIPYTPVFFTALATMIARKVYRLRNAHFKVLVFDADHTLWDGVCGEDGALGVRIDEPHRATQEFLVHQHDAGMLLCVCSKNNEEDVAEVFERCPEMPLRRKHLVAWRVNWRPKSENLRSLAQELGLGLDSLIFLDDDPVECAEVQAGCPEVLALPLPRNQEQVPAFLRHVWLFDRIDVTAEGVERTRLYQEDHKRQQSQAGSPTLKDFLASLGLRVRITAPVAHELARVAELTQRTNQFNLTTRRRSAAAVQHLCQEGQAECLAVHVKDRFGAYGLVGVLLFKATADALAVDTFLLSCRALGRGVEHQMLAHLGAVASQRGLSRVDLRCVPSGKNEPALRFLNTVGRAYSETAGEGYLFRLPANVAAAVRYEPAGADPMVDPPVQASAGARRVGDSRAQAALLRSIATDLATVEQIHQMVSSRARARPESRTPFVAPRSAIEKQLAEMCSAVLGIEQVGINDNFFDLGGHSLLATQVLSRMRQAFQVDVSPAVLLTGRFTVAELAKTVAKQQVQRAEPQEVAALLKKLNELSDDQVRALLAGHDGRQTEQPSP